MFEASFKACLKCVQSVFKDEWLGRQRANKEQREHVPCFSDFYYVFLSAFCNVKRDEIILEMYYLY